ncbi:Bug family tripartite tricarboxylate transporter substrate binding protein [Sabulicella glaciei]|uniref:Tripartite tricarboxylate transporter substrate binding protein n=1 Tax=Sabulicella glaciei TaxID=2984948 RepID=A0ABT3NX27_9PROT|nr:tripartite tricarboxylate transporter substrate binding protein [Roseococcus sp. MDT2-1-1]MCW8086712.1 tripartite tricarboxylate transporter substrate binding protein [Roseococcus sp. MDT2-1-1]
MQRRSLAAALALAPLAVPAFAQGTAPWQPERPIRFVVGFAAGGSTDITGRLVAEAISPALGQPVVVENRVGAAGNIGSEAVARAAPDGHTFVVASVGTHTTNQFLYPNMGFHVVNDFTPVSLVLTSSAVLVVHPSVRARSVAELIALARENPGGLNLGTSGTGATQHFAAALFEEKAGVRFTHVPYRGGAPAMADLLAGRVQVIFSPLAEAMGGIRGGQIIPLGVTRNGRMPALPEVPPISDTVPGYEFNSWIGIFGPPRLPEPIVRRMSQVIAEAVRSPATRQRMEDLGYLPEGGSAEDLARVQQRDFALMEHLVRVTGAAQQ